MKKQIDYLTFKFWEVLYDASWFVFGNLPITFDVKHKMNMAYVRYHLHPPQN